MRRLRLPWRAADRTLESLHESHQPSRPLLRIAVGVACGRLPCVEVFVGSKRLLGRIPTLCVDAAQFEAAIVIRLLAQSRLASRAIAASSAAGSIVTKRTMP